MMHEKKRLCRDKVTYRKIVQKLRVKDKRRPHNPFLKGTARRRIFPAFGGSLRDVGARSLV